MAAGLLCAQQGARLPSVTPESYRSLVQEPAERKTGRRGSNLAISDASSRAISTLLHLERAQGSIRPVWYGIGLDVRLMTESLCFEWLTAGERTNWGRCVLSR